MTGLHGDEPIPGFALTALGIHHIPANLKALISSVRFIDEDMDKVFGPAAKTGIDKAVVMTFNIKEGHSLINYRRGISIEVGNHQSYNSFLTTLE